MEHYTVKKKMPSFFREKKNRGFIGCLVVENYYLSVTTACFLKIPAFAGLKFSCRTVPGSLNKKGGRRFYLGGIFCYVKGSIFFNTLVLRNQHR
jgi:hypothetical protein